MEIYPTERVLKRIEKFDIVKRPISELLDLIRNNWWMPEWGYKISGKRIIRLELHTGGWSGNESIIYALNRNPLWNMYWRKSTVGGHHYYKITPIKEG